MSQTQTRFVDEEHLMKLLTRLKLTALRDNLDNLLEAASKEELSYRELVYLLCREEANHKDARRIRMGLSIAHFPCVRTFESFDWEAQPSLERSRVEELRHCRWVANAEALLLLGPPGMGRSVRGHGSDDSDTGSSTAPQPCGDDPWGELSVVGKALLRPDCANRRKGGNAGLKTAGIGRLFT